MRSRERRCSLSWTEPQAAAHALTEQAHGRVLCVTGVSGGGKGTVIDVIRGCHPDLAWSVSMTTRPQRPGEIHTEHYDFVDDETFDKVVADGGFLEWAHVYGHRSGTPKAPIDRWLADGRDVLIEADAQGALAIKEAYPGAIVVFLQPLDKAIQRTRLTERGTTGSDLERRLAEVDRELSLAGHFDAVVINDELDVTIDEVERLFFQRPLRDRPAQDHKTTKQRG